MLSPCENVNDFFVFLANGDPSLSSGFVSTQRFVSSDGPCDSNVIVQSETLLTASNTKYAYGSTRLERLQSVQVHTRIKPYFADLNVKSRPP